MRKKINIFYEKLNLLSCAIENKLNEMEKDSNECTESDEFFNVLVCSAKLKFNIENNRYENIPGDLNDILEKMKVFNDANSTNLIEYTIIISIVKSVIDKIFSFNEGEYHFSADDKEFNEIEYCTNNSNNLKEFLNHINVDEDNENNNIFIITYKVCGTDNLSFEDVLCKATNNDELFYLLDALEIEKDDFFSKTICIFNKNIEFDEERILAYLKLSVIYKGDIIHKQITTSRKVSYKGSHKFEIAKEYIQFEDVLYIFSEYNDSKDILIKYLRLYQIFENFMYKSPISELINKSPNKMISIRKFKLLNKKVADNEISCLDGLIKEIFKEQYSSTMSLEDFVKDSLMSLKGIHPTIITDVSNELKDINIHVDQLENIHKHGNFSNIIYLLRNSIVHNKETEHHIAHNNLDQNVTKFMDEFLLVCMEEIILFLIINRTSLVTYGARNIKLY